MTIIRWRDHFAAFGRRAWAVPYLVKLIVLAAILAAACWLGGCAKERAQEASNNHARLQAAATNQDTAKTQLAIAITAVQQLGAAAQPVLDALAIVAASNDRAAVLVKNADASLPAVADVPSSDYPAPTHSADELAKHPEVDVPAPEPKGYTGRILAGLAIAGSAALFIIGKVAPSVPGAGTMVGGLANLAWSMLAHSDQKAADQAATQTVAVASEALPIMQAIAAVPPEDLPPWLRGLLTPERRATVVRYVDQVAGPKA